MIRDRLFKELDRNVALKVSETDSSDTYEICGRGQLHLTVLIENMRREGFELLIGRLVLFFCVTLYSIFIYFMHPWQNISV